METDRAAYLNSRGKRVIILPITSYDYSLYKRVLKSHITTGLLHPITTDPGSQIKINQIYNYLNYNTPLISRRNLIIKIIIANCPPHTLGRSWIYFNLKSSVLYTLPAYYKGDYNILESSSFSSSSTFLLWNNKLLI